MVGCVGWKSGKKKRNEVWWWWWSGCQMLGGLFGERQTAGVQHLALPPTDWQLQPTGGLLLSSNPASNLFFFRWNLICKKYSLIFAQQLV